MSFLDDPEEFDLDSPADLVRLSVLSKKWFALTASFPILNLDIRNFETTSLFPHDYYYLKYVDYTTSRFCKQNVSAHTFNLIAVIEDPSQLNIIDICVRLILKKRVKVLLIDIIDKNFSLVYLLPDLLLSASLLTSLTLCNCDLPSSLTVDDVKFKFLKLLDLDYILLNEEMIECLTISFPLLEEMHLYRCYGFKTNMYLWSSKSSKTPD
ncbi:F-box domain containing protein [Tanacetum coccineum]